jgi:hypothetical protein
VVAVRWEVPTQNVDHPASRRMLAIVAFSGGMWLL